MNIMSINEILQLVSNPAISAIFGAIIGAILTVFSGYGVEYWKGKQFKKRIKNFVKAELQIYRNFLTELLEKGEVNEIVKIRTGSDFFRQVKQMLPEHKFNQTNYTGLTAETKSQIFDVESLHALDGVYRLVGYFQINEHYEGVTTLDYLFVSKNEIEKILAFIEIAEKTLN